MAGHRLKLSAVDADDMSVIAACAQDALVPISEMSFLPEEKRFVLALNRFRWDRLEPQRMKPADGGPTATKSGDAAFLDAANGGSAYERVMSGLRFESVKAVRTKGVDLRNRDRILELLTIHVEPGVVLLVFSGTAIIRLEVDELRCYLEDFGESWPTRWRPRHAGGTVGGPE